MYRALGRTGRVEALEILGAKNLDRDRRRAETARLLAIGGIRHEDAVETLVRLYSRVGRFTSREYDEALQVSFAALTGVELRPGRQPLLDWWKENEDDFELPSVAPQLESPRLAAAWERFWEPERTPETPR